MTNPETPQKKHGKLKVLGGLIAATLGVQKEDAWVDAANKGRARDYIIGGILFTLLLVGGLIAIARLALPS